MTGQSQDLSLDPGNEECPFALLFLHECMMARQLGRRITEHERFTSLKAAQKVVNEDTEATQLIQEYQQQAAKIQQMEQQQKPVEVDDKHKLQEIGGKISLNENLKELTRRQADFIELMKELPQKAPEGINFTDEEINAILGGNATSIFDL